MTGPGRLSPVETHEHLSQTGNTAVFQLHEAGMVLPWGSALAAAPTQAPLHSRRKMLVPALT